MKKTISLFKRDYEGNRQVYNEVVEGAQWVLDGEGVATRKYDGTCCLIENGELWKRYEVRKGKKPPEGFRPATDVDEMTGKQQGWVKVGDGPDDKWHREALEAWKSTMRNFVLPDGTYELVGPKVQGNPEGEETHVLVSHADAEQYPDCPRTFDALKVWLAEMPIEGVVWHHPDGERMVKIKKKDFGLKR